jgi:hypothetical protein
MLLIKEALDAASNVSNQGRQLLSWCTSSCFDQELWITGHSSGKPGQQLTAVCIAGRGLHDEPFHQQLWQLLPLPTKPLQNDVYVYHMSAACR